MSADDRGPHVGDPCCVCGSRSTALFHAGKLAARALGIESKRQAYCKKCLGTLVTKAQAAAEQEPDPGVIGAPATAMGCTSCGAELKPGEPCETCAARRY